MLWKILIFAIAGYALFRLFMNDKNKKNVDQQKEREDLIASGELVKDPSCGTYVDPESAITVKSGEDKFYFCSYECREKFIKQIEQ